MKTIEMISSRSSYSGQPTSDRMPGPATPPGKIAKVRYRDVPVCLANGFGVAEKPSKEVCDELIKHGLIQSAKDLKIYVPDDELTQPRLLSVTKSVEAHIARPVRKK